MSRIYESTGRDSGRKLSAWTIARSKRANKKDEQKGRTNVKNIISEYAFYPLTVSGQTDIINSSTRETGFASKGAGSLNRPTPLCNGPLGPAVLSAFVASVDLSNANRRVLAV